MLQSKLKQIKTTAMVYEEGDISYSVLAELGQLVLCGIALLQLVAPTYPLLLREVRNARRRSFG